jgi:hypothetical protein
MFSGCAFRDLQVILTHQQVYKKLVCFCLFFSASFFELARQLTSPYCLPVRKLEIFLMKEKVLKVDENFVVLLMHTILGRTFEHSFMD